MIHDQFISQCISDVRLLYFLVHEGVHDAHAAVYAERQSHFLVHRIEVRVTNLIDQLAYSDDARLIANRKTQYRPKTFTLNMRKASNLGSCDS